MTNDQQRIFICPDSNHIHDQALAVRKACAPLVSIACKRVIFDTIIVKHVTASMLPDRQWSLGKIPNTSEREFLKF